MSTHIRIKNEDSPYIFSFPHSGERLTSEMKRELTPRALGFLPNVDWYLNELYAFLEAYNVNIISTPYSRYVVDVNRPPSANYNVPSKNNQIKKIFYSQNAKIARRK